MTEMVQSSESRRDKFINKYRGSEALRMPSDTVK